MAPRKQPVDYRGTPDGSFAFVRMADGSIEVVDTSGHDWSRWGILASGALALATLAAFAMGGKRSRKPPAVANGLIDLPGGLKAEPLLQVASDVPAPLVIVLHGREGTEKQLQAFVPKDLGARVFFLRGSLPGPKSSWSFFAPRLADPNDVLLPAMQVALNALLESIEFLRTQYPTTIVVLGGSQGGALAYALAALGAINGAVVISGALPQAWWPAEASGIGVIAVHGTADKTIPFATGKATIDAFNAAGAFTQWVPIARGTHVLTQAKPQVGEALRLAVKGFEVP